MTIWFGSAAGCERPHRGASSSATRSMFPSATNSSLPRKPPCWCWVPLLPGPGCPPKFCVFWRRKPIRSGSFELPGGRPVMIPVMRCSGFALAVLPLAVACAPGLPPLPMPVGLAEGSAETAARWADSSRPADNRDLRFRFQFQDEDGAASGRGRARLGLPDSLRFDVAGPLGAGRASAFVVGDSAIWTEPEEEIRKLVPNYPLFWAML